MPRLPTALQPLWPVAKRAHRLATRCVGAATRRLPGDGPRRPPRTGAAVVDEIVAGAPATARLHVVGPAEDLDRPMPLGEPARHWVFDRWGRFEAARRYLLELDGGTVVGDVAAPITAEGVLDYESSTYFGVAGWREHPVFLSPRLPEPTEVDGDVLCLAARGSSANYYHFLLDVVPRWGVFQDALPGHVPDVLYVPTRARYQRELLGLIGIDSIATIEPGPDVAVRARRLLVPCIPNPELMAPRWTTEWLRTHLRPERLEGRPRRLYVTRGSARNTRRVVNEAEVVDYLATHGFEVFDPGQHSVQDQIDHFAAADYVIAPHGAALANLAFSPARTRVLELFAPNYVNPCYWALASNIPDVDYRYLVCGTDRRRVGAPQNGVLTDITVDLARLRASVEAQLRSRATTETG